MKKILTYGTYDSFHHGHVNILRGAKELGDYLIVGISTDEFAYQKGNHLTQNYEVRKLIVESMRYVDEIIPEYNLEQKKEDIIRYEIDVLVMGDNWRGGFDELEMLCEVVYLPETIGVPRTNVKKLLVGSK